jgi:hypothetical protein
MVRAAGLEPAQLFRAEGFLYYYGFRRRALARSRIRLVCCLDYTFTVARASRQIVITPVDRGADERSAA